MRESESQIFALLQAQHAVLRALLASHPHPAQLEGLIEHYAESVRIVFLNSSEMSESARSVFESEVKTLLEFCRQLASASRA